MARDLLLIDLSSIAVPIYKMSGSEADPNHAATQTVARVRALAAGVAHVVVCCDSGRSFRAEISDTYKANRPETDAPLIHQMRLAQETLRADGFPVWSVKGFEADDLIASAVARALEDADDAEDTFVTIASADKDLLQLVGWHVTAKSLRDGSVIDEAAVKAKFGVRPDQIVEYLMLVGDASDNIKGAKGVGPKTAAKLLDDYGDLMGIYAHLDALTPALRQALDDFGPCISETRELVTLRTDVPLPFAEAYAPRVPTTPDTLTPAMSDIEAEAVPATVVDESPAPTPAPAPAPKPEPMADVQPVKALTVAHAPREFTRELEPRTLNEAGQLAKWVYESRQFSAYGTPQAVLATVLAGRELGLQAMASLRAIHIVEGKPTLSADLIRALVINSGHARYFRVTERTPERATFETQRGDDPPVSLSFTIDEGRAMWKKGDDAWKKSGWGTFPADMLVARASAKLARLVYPDICFGLYTPDELTDGRAA
jgi:5'-3' exonuclease